MQTIYGNVCTLKTMVTDWCRQFCQGQQSTADMPWSGLACVATTAVEAAIQDRSVSTEAGTQGMLTAAGHSSETTCSQLLPAVAFEILQLRHPALGNSVECMYECGQ
jgi:hypothetical protein